MGLLKNIALRIKTKETMGIIIKDMDFERMKNPEAPIEDILEVIATKRGVPTFLLHDSTPWQGKFLVIVFHELRRQLHFDRSFGNEKDIEVLSKVIDKHLPERWRIGIEKNQ